MKRSRDVPLGRATLSPEQDVKERCERCATARIVAQRWEEQLKRLAPIR
jgi:hypothetical protein